MSAKELGITSGGGAAVRDIWKLSDAPAVTAGGSERERCRRAQLALLQARQIKRPKSERERERVRVTLM